MKLPHYSKEKITVGLTLALFLVLLFIMSFQYENDSDFYWHLAAGRYFIETGRFLTHDIFSFTFPHKEWFNIFWLFDSFTYTLFTAGGYVLVNIFRFFLLSITYILLYCAACTKKRPSLLAFLLISLLTLPLIRSFTFRPEITLPLFIAYYLWALFGFKYRNTKLIYSLPLVELIWVNIHGGFIFGLLLIFIFFVFEFARSILRNRTNLLTIFSNKRLGKLFFVGIASGLAIMINPYGFGIIEWLPKMMVPTQEIREVMSNILEWSSIPLSSFISPAHSDVLFLSILFWIAITYLIVMVYRSVRRAKTADEKMQSLLREEILLLPLFMHQAIQHTRFMFLAAFVCGVIILKIFSRKTRTLRSRPVPLPIVLSVVIVLVLTALHASARLHVVNGPQPQRFPEDAANFIVKHGLSGNILNDYNDGGYLLWRLYPGIKVFIDGRTVNVYDADFYWRYVHLGDPEILSKTMQQFQPNVTLLASHSGIPQQLLETKEWHTVFFDESRILLVKNSPKHSELIKDHSYILLDPTKKYDIYKAVCNKTHETDLFKKEVNQNFQDLTSPTYAALALTSFTLECASSSEADYQNVSERLQAFNYEEAPTESEAEIRYLHGRILLKLNDNAAALKQFTQAFNLSPSARYATAEGVALFNLEQYQLAEKRFEKAALLGDVPQEHYQTYGWTLYYLDKNHRAAELIQRYLDMTPTEKHTAVDYLFLSKALTDDGQHEKAREALNQAKALDPGALIE